jgi:hypothetical protein
MTRLKCVNGKAGERWKVEATSVSSKVRVIQWRKQLHNLYEDIRKKKLGNAD